MDFYDPTSGLKDSWTNDMRAAYWDSRAKRYSDDFDKADVKARMASAIASKITQGRVHRLLDIGTGCGQLTFTIHKQGLAREYYGVDFAPKMIEEARSYAQSARMNTVAFDVADARRLPYQAGFFDAVVSSMALHHLDDADKVVSLREIRRVLTANGLFVIGDLLFSFSTVSVPLMDVRRRVQSTFFPRESPEEVAARFRDEPKEWPVSVWEYQAMMCKEGFIVRETTTLNEVVSIIAAEVGG